MIGTGKLQACLKVSFLMYLSIIMGVIADCFGEGTCNTAYRDI